MKSETRKKALEIFDRGIEIVKGGPGSGPHGGSGSTYKGAESRAREQTGIASAASASVSKKDSSASNAAESAKKLHDALSQISTSGKVPTKEYHEHLANGHERLANYHQSQMHYYRDSHPNADHPTVKQVYKLHRDARDEHSYAAQLHQHAASLKTPKV